MLLCITAVAQLWCTGVLLLSRQIDSLSCVGIVGCVFWSWCFWGTLLRKQRLGLILAGMCLVFSLALTALCLMDMLDKSGASFLQQFAQCEQYSRAPA